MKTIGLMVVCAVIAAFAWGVETPVYAHCDTLDGPVIADAKTALAAKEITPVLKWVKKEKEEEIRRMFAKTLDISVKLPEAKEYAEMYFFETLVRIHREGEGAPYTGLKSEKAEPIVSMSDQALISGNGDQLAEAVASHVKEGIKTRFAKASEKKKHTNESVEAGRAYVEAYVEFVHYVEKLHDDAVGKGGHAHETPKGDKPDEQKHHEGHKQP